MGARHEKAVIGKRDLATTIGSTLSRVARNGYSRSIKEEPNHQRPDGVLHAAVGGFRSSVLRSQQHPVRRGKSAACRGAANPCTSCCDDPLPDLIATRRACLSAGAGYVSICRALVDRHRPPQGAAQVGASPCSCPPPPFFASWVCHRRRRPARGFGSRRRQRVEPASKRYSNLDYEVPAKIRENIKGAH